MRKACRYRIEAKRIGIRVRHVNVVLHKRISEIYPNINPLSNTCTKMKYSPCTTGTDHILTKSFDGKAIGHVSTADCLQERQYLKEIRLAGAVSAYKHIDVAEFDLDITHALEARDGNSFYCWHIGPSICGLKD